jgi:hypothetical protein
MACVRAGLTLREKVERRLLSNRTEAGQVKGAL